MATPFSLNTQLCLLLIGRLPWVCTQFYFFRKSIVNSRKVRTKQSMILIDRKKNYPLKKKLYFSVTFCPIKLTSEYQMTEYQ